MKVPPDLVAGSRVAMELSCTLMVMMIVLGWWGRISMFL